MTEKSPKSAKAYWNRNLDPQNLEREPEASRPLTLNEEIIFASTPDVEAAREWLLRARRAPACIVDLGAGLGAIGFAFARRGSWVVAVDSSLDRMKQLRERARRSQCENLVTPIVAAAEALPFTDQSMPAIFTKSVLIHADIPAAVGEIARVLSPGGRAALLEPQPGNPFAWLYRNTLAPKAWKPITRYFNRDLQRFCIERIGGGYVRPFYLFSFLAFVFQYRWPHLERFGSTLKFLRRIDVWIFTHFRFTRRLAWFGAILAEKPHGVPPKNGKRAPGRARRTPNRKGTKPQRT